jgi:hypothetical protein
VQAVWLHDVTLLLKLGGCLGKGDSGFDFSGDRTKICEKLKMHKQVRNGDGNPIHRTMLSDTLNELPEERCTLGVSRL